MRRPLPSIVSMVALFPLGMIGQTTAQRSFEVASIRPHDGPLSRIADFRSSGPRLTLEGYGVSELILEAYNLKRYQISFRPGDAPDANAFYDIAAEAAGPGVPTRDEFREMLRSLLADRFNLKFHREMRDLPVYELVVDKNGPSLKPGSGDEPCSSKIGPVRPADRNYRYQYTNCDLETLVNGLLMTMQSDRPILDKTGLNGRYDMSISATPQFKMGDAAEPGDVPFQDAIRTLGLKVESRRAMVGILFVDHVEKPSAN